MFSLLRLCFAFQGEIYVKNGKCVRFYCHNISFTKCGEGSPQCSRVSLLQTKRERFSCITRHDDFSLRSHRVVSLQVDPFLRDSRGRSQGELTVRGMDFRKPRLGEYTAATSLCYLPEVSHCSRNRISVSSGKGLNFITSDVFLLLKYDGNYNWFDFLTIRTAQMQSCGKTRNMSTSKARGTNNNKELTILRLRNASRKEC